MPYPVVTALTAGLIALLQTVLMVSTILSRYQLRQGLGDSHHPKLLARVRSHGNLTENAPIVLIILALLEMAAVPVSFVGTLAGLFVVGRLLHPLGLYRSSGASLPRALGVLLTIIVLVGGSLVLIYTAIERLL